MTAKMQRRDFITLLGGAAAPGTTCRSAICGRCGPSTVRRSCSTISGAGRVRGRSGGGNSTLQNPGGD
jgi:hypothetical protein